jgi:hypothetical protein
MDALTKVDLGDLHDAIVDRIAEAFPALQTVAAYREEDERTQLMLPACLVELAEMEADPDEDPGTEQLAIWCRFEAQIIVGFRESRAKVEVRKLAAALARFTLRNRWGLPVGPAQVAGCYRDDFDPQLDQFEVMRLEWRQLVHIGDSVWTGEGVTPTEIRYSWAPKIGLPFRDNYRTLEDGGAIPE